jgi:hypothetical protein
MRIGLALLATPLLALLATRAEALDLTPDISVSGYADLRLIAPSDQTSWVKGGLGKFRYGPNRGNFRFAEGVAQLDAHLDEDFTAIAVARAEPDDSSGLDVLEAYGLWAPHSDGAVSW